MNRREFMQCAMLLASGLTASSVAFSLTEEQQHFVARANYNAHKVDFFSKAQRAAVTAAAEIIMPTTDTPGAIDAGVPRFIELMLADWLEEQEQQVFMAGLAALMQTAQSRHGHAFDTLDAAQQLALLEELEEDASASSWYDFGNTQREFISDAPFICQLKELTIWGFFTSEIGGTQVLRYEAMPMRFDGHLKLEPYDSSWATNFY